jgi:hypothetical protein
MALQNSKTRYVLKRSTDIISMIVEFTKTWITATTYQVSNKTTCSSICVTEILQNALFQNRKCGKNLWSPAGTGTGGKIRNRKWVCLTEYDYSTIIARYHWKVLFHCVYGKKIDNFSLPKSLVPKLDICQLLDKEKICSCVQGKRDKFTRNTSMEMNVSQHFVHTSSNKLCQGNLQLTVHTRG